MPETWVQSLGQEDLLEKGMATHSSILAWRIPWTEEPDGLQSWWATVHGIYILFFPKELSLGTYQHTSKLTSCEVLRKKNDPFTRDTK